MSPEEFDAVESVEPGWRYELVDGRVIIMVPPSIQSRRPNDELAYLLLKYQYEHPQGAALNDTVSEHLLKPGGARRVADRVIWAGLGRKPDHVDDVPAIAVEFVSEGRRNRTRDYDEKLREYVALGVREYWIIDRFDRTMTVWAAPSVAGGEVTATVVAADGTYRTPLLPGFELPLARILAAADRWSESAPPVPAAAATPARPKPRKKTRKKKP
jgi:Uma2 family endonuclease